MPDYLTDEQKAAVWARTEHGDNVYSADTVSKLLRELGANRLTIDGARTTIDEMRQQLNDARAEHQRHIQEIDRHARIIAECTKALPDMKRLPALEKALQGFVNWFADGCRGGNNHTVQLLQAARAALGPTSSAPQPAC